MTPYEKIRGQKYRKEILPMGEQVLADNQVNQHIEVPQIQHTDRVADESVVSQRQISSRTTETKALEHQWDDRSGGDSRIEIPTLTKDQKALHIASKKETVADDTANSNSITSRVSQTTVISAGTWRNLLPQGKRRRLTIRHVALILTRYNVRRNTRLMFVQTPEHCSS